MERVRFEDIVTRVNTKEDRFNTDKIYYVGGEHIESNDIKVHQRGIIKGSTIGPMFYCGFKAGDVLFVTRNPHLRKCAVVDFDGICSEKTFVLGTKDSSRLLQEYLPLIMQSDDFWAYCEENKSGGVNFFVNWSTLANYEFELPSLEEQRVLADKLWAAYEVKESYKNLLAQTDKLLHAQFEKMFGEVENRPLHEACDIVMGSSPDSSTYNNERNGLPFYQGKTEFGEMYVENPTIYCSQPIREAKQNDILMSVRAPVGAVNFAIDHCCIGRGLCSIRAKEDTTEQLFVFYALKIQENEIERLGTGSTIKCINKEQVYKIPIPKCDKNTQHEFVRIAEQAERTKASLNKGIEAIEAVIRSLIAEGTTKV